jgi:hypothetical protein
MHDDVGPAERCDSRLTSREAASSAHGWNASRRVPHRGNLSGVFIRSLALSAESA